VETAAQGDGQNASTEFLVRYMMMGVSFRGTGKNRRPGPLVWGCEFNRKSALGGESRKSESARAGEVDAGIVFGWFISINDECDGPHDAVRL